MRIIEFDSLHQRQATCWQRSPFRGLVRTVFIVLAGPHGVELGKSHREDWLSQVFYHLKHSGGHWNVYEGCVGPPLSGGVEESCELDTTQ